MICVWYEIDALSGVALHSTRRYLKSPEKTSPPWNSDLEQVCAALTF